MNITNKKRKDILIINISGEVSCESDIPKMRRNIAKLIDEIPNNEQPKVVLNLKDITVNDNCVFNVIILTNTKVQERKGRLVLSDTETIESRIKTAMYDRMFDIYPNDEQAVASFTKGE